MAILVRQPCTSAAAAMDSATAGILGQARQLGIHAGPAAGPAAGALLQVAHPLLLGHVVLELVAHHRLHAELGLLAGQQAAIRPLAQLHRLLEALVDGRGHLLDYALEGHIAHRKLSQWWRRARPE